MDEREFRDLDQEATLGSQDQQSRAIEDSAQQMGDKAKELGSKATDRIKSKSSEHIKKQLGVDKKLNQIKGKGTQTLKKGTTKAGKAATKGAKSATKAVSKSMKKIASKFGKQFAKAALKAALPYIGWIAGGIVVVAGVSFAAGVILDNEASRTNEANYQHASVKDVNHVSKNGIELTDSNNVFFNKATKRYELGKGRAPTQANKLYYVYYAVMSQQSRWFVEFERTSTKPGDPDAGTEKNPYWKPIKREGDYAKYTLDGYLFNNNVIDKVNLRPVNPDKPLTLENLIDEKAAAGVNKLSLNTNLLYLLNSTLNGNLHGTGKNEMFFAEQFIKPVYHDSTDYSFKSLTAVRDMTDKEKEDYKAKAHGDSEDGKQELEFQKKYERWGQTLDVQNEARGGTSSAGDKDYGSADSADGIDNEILKKAYEWGTSQLNKGITYSMANRNGPNSYDCSSFVTRALTEAGMTGVDGLSTVGMLTNSNAFGQSGTKFKQVDYKTAKKGTIIVVGGLSGAGANGHTFFLAEDYHGDDTKVLECNSGTNGIANHQTFKTQSMDYNQVVALEPIVEGNTGGSSSSKTSKSSGSKKHNTSGDYTKDTKNKYKGKVSTGKLDVESRVFDTAYSPTIQKNLFRVENINENIWTRGDFYISGETGSISSIPNEINVAKYLVATNNSKFQIGSGPTAGKEGKAERPESNDALLPPEYRDYRDEITAWSFKNGYNPAFIVAMIKVLSDDGNAQMVGSKFNFLNDKDAVSTESSSDSDSEKKEDKEKEKKETEKTENKDSKDKNKDSTKTDSEEKNETDDPTWKDYGKEYYKYESKVSDINSGLDYFASKLTEKNEGKDWNYDVAKKLKIKKADYNKINEVFAKAGGVGEARAKMNSDLSDVTVYTYDGSGNEDPKALGVISIDGKPDETEIDGYKKYVSVKRNIKQADAVVPNTASKDHPYAIKRGKDGEPEKKKGVWDYGFGSIFKIAKQTYEAYEIGIDEHGNYYIAKNDSEGLLSFWLNKDVTSDTQYQILGATTAFGSIDMSNEIVESQWAIEQVIEKLKRGETLSGADIALLDKHKEGTSLRVNGKEVVAGENNFFVSTKPRIDKDPEAQNINGAQYLYDYVMNYETYIPSTTQNKLNVVDRWKAMNDANASTQEATDKILDIFNNLIGDGKSKSSSSSSSGGSTEGGVGDGGLDQSEQAKKVRKEVYKLLIDGGMGSVGAIGIMTNWVAESNIDPTTTYGEYVSKYVVSEQDKYTAFNTDKPIGLGQWLGGRKTHLLEYAKQKGKNWSDTDLQIDFMLRGEPESIRATLPLVAQAKDVTQAASRFFMGWEIHGGGASFADNDPNSDPLAVSNNIKGHLSKATSDALWKELVLPEGEVKPDLSKLSNGSSTLSNSGGSSTTGSAGAISNWGDGSGFAGLIADFLSKIQGTVLSLFGGNENWDPTMFATDPTTNERSLFSSKKENGGEVEKWFESGKLYINGADAYTWTHKSNKQSEKNATMLVRQFVASLESRENRPVYYDEIYDNWNEYEISRILEENYKLVFKGLFKSQKDNANERKADITSGPFKGVGLGDTEVISGYGWRKTGDKVELFPGYTFKHEDGAEITAMKAGKVVYVGNDLTTGQKTIIIRSKNNTEQIAYSGFGSLAGFKVNDNIQAGDVLGKASSSGEISIFGIHSREDVSKGLPTFPTEVDNNSAYFDLGHNFGISADGRKKLLKEVNGYDSDKNTIKKPKASSMKGKSAKLSNFITSGGDGDGGGIGDGSFKDIQPNYSGITSYPHGECTWGAKALAPWAGDYWGNGGQWAASARSAGFTVNDTPKVGSIACWTDGGYGHVAVVVAVESKGRIQVKESNYNGNRYVSNFRGWFDPRYVQGTVSYIHPK